MGHGKLEPFIDKDHDGSPQSNRFINRKNLFCFTVSVSSILIATAIGLFFHGVVSISQEPSGSVGLYEFGIIVFTFLLTISLSTLLIYLSTRVYLWYTNSLPIPESEMTEFHVIIDNGMAYSELKPLIQDFIRTIDEIRGFPVNGDMRKLKAFYKTFEPEKPAEEKSEFEKSWDRIKEDTLKK